MCMIICAVHCGMEVIYFMPTTVRNISGSNSSEDEMESLFSEGTLIFLYIFIPLITSVTVFGNTFVILAFIVDKRLRNQSNFFLLNLAICDFFIGVFCIPVSASYMLTDKWTLGYFLCKVWLIADNLMCTASVFNIVLISYDRFLSITMAVMHRSQQNNHSQTAVKMTAVWVLSFLLYSPAIIFGEYLNGGTYIPEGMCVAGYYYSWYFLLGTSTFDFFLPLISISFFNLSIYWNIRMRSRKRSQTFTPMLSLPLHENGMTSAPAIISNIVERRDVKKQIHILQISPKFKVSSSKNSAHAVKLSRDKKIAQSLIVLVCVFGICLAPYTFLQTIRAACHDECVESYWNQVTSWMLWINSSVNPIIYPLCHKSIRDALVKLTQKCKFRL